MGQRGRGRERESSPRKAISAAAAAAAVGKEREGKGKKAATNLISKFSRVETTIRQERERGGAREREKREI